VALETYRRKRDFAKTPEPGGHEPTGGPSTTGRFVVQRHRARRLHYDFRLEIDGVLVSWSVPKGPTLDPKARRLAVHVEDHPIEYIDFEGVIPKGEYGGGDVIVWDQGTWTLATDGERRKPKDARKALDRGELHIDLDGHKLCGRFVLVRTSKPHEDEQWMLLHKRDEWAVDGWDPEEHPQSVVSGLTNDEVAAKPEAYWHSTTGRAAGPAATFAGPTAEELAELDSLKKAGAWSLGGHDLRLTNLDKVMYPRTKDSPAFTKRDVIRYYAQIAPVMLPHLSERALNLRRYPDGIETKGFWHKAAPSHMPEWIRRWRNPDADPGETQEYLLADSAAALAWLGNYGALEIHPWTSQIHARDRPTYALMDIDPGTKTSWDDVLLLARLHRTALEHLGVRAGVKVTGSKGIHLYIPIEPTVTFAATRKWVEQVSAAIGRTAADVVSWEWDVKARGGLARLDYTQNAINKTLVAPYSLRARPGATVSIPITWDELDDPELRPDGWSMTDVLARVDAVGDLFATVLTFDQKLPPLS
jgi:bifunctional non-homologous end joining protein LigD